MNKKLTYSLIGIVILIAVVTFLERSRNNSPSPSVEAQSTNASINLTTENGGSIKEFTVDGSNYQFSPNKINVNKGDLVKIIFKDDDGTHNLVIEDYDVATNTISGGSQDIVQFVANKSGQFEFYCSVGSHRDLGMTGKLIVN